jgi:hypothetical protein
MLKKINHKIDGMKLGQYIIHLVDFRLPKGSIIIIIIIISLMIPQANAAVFGKKSEIVKYVISLVAYARLLQANITFLKY